MPPNPVPWTCTLCSKHIDGFLLQTSLTRSRNQAADEELQYQTNLCQAHAPLPTAIAAARALNNEDDTSHLTPVELDDDHIFDDLFDTDIYQPSDDSGQLSDDSEIHFPGGPPDYESQLSGSDNEVYQGRATMFDEDAVDLLNDPEFIRRGSILGEQVDKDSRERDRGGDGDKSDDGDEPSIMDDHPAI